MALNHTILSARPPNLECRTRANRPKIWGTPLVKNSVFRNRPNSQKRVFWHFWSQKSSSTLIIIILITYIYHHHQICQKWPLFAKCQKSSKNTKKGHFWPFGGSRLYPPSVFQIRIFGHFLPIWARSKFCKKCQKQRFLAFFQGVQKPPKITIFDDFCDTTILFIVIINIFIGLIPHQLIFLSWHGVSHNWEWRSP